MNKKHFKQIKFNKFFFSLNQLYFQNLYKKIELG
jgi:hypothetical protein